MSHASSRRERLQHSPTRLESPRSRPPIRTRPADRSSETVHWPRLIAILALGSVLGVALGVVSDAFDWPDRLADAIALVTAAVLAAVMLSHARGQDPER